MDLNNYYETLGALPPEQRPSDCEYYSDDEIEYMWATSMFEETGELYF